MCGRVVCALDENILINMANTKTLKNNIRYRQSYNITPSGNIPGVYKNNKEMEVEIMKWGFKNKDDILISNARSDSVPLYQIYKDSKRCVIVVQGYYEWKQCISASEEVTRQPYYIKPKDEDFFLFAGVYKMSIDEVKTFFIFLSMVSI